MILLQTKHEEENVKLLEKRLKADIDAKTVQMMKENIREARKEKEAAVHQNKALKNSITEM